VSATRQDPYILDMIKFRLRDYDITQEDFNVLIDKGLLIEVKEAASG